MHEHVFHHVEPDHQFHLQLHLLVLLLVVPQVAIPKVPVSEQMTHMQVLERMKQLLELAGRVSETEYIHDISVVQYKRSNMYLKWVEL